VRLSAEAQRRTVLLESVEEAQMSQRDCATRYASWNIVILHNWTKIRLSKCMQ